MIWLFLILLLISVAVCLYCFYTCFYASNKEQRDPYGLLHGSQYQEVKESIYECTRRMEDVAFEAVTISSYDGLKLYGRYYHLQDGAPVKIIFHGYRSIALRDSAGGFGLARKLGMNVLAVDQRAHGKSEGHVISFGIRERYDCLAWVQYINTRFGNETPIILSGLSMGAATVIMAASTQLPSNVACILADCPYSSPKEIICKVCKNQHFPVAIAYPFIRMAARYLGGFHLEEMSAVTAAQQSKIPILLLHGEDDRFVPCDMSRQIHAHSDGHTQLATFPYAGHGLSYMIDPVRYEKVVIDFLKTIPALKELSGLENPEQTASK